MKKHLLWLMLICSCSARAQEKIFSAQDLLATVKKFHPVAKQALIDVRIAEAGVLSARGNFDPMLAAGNARKELEGINYYDQWTTQLTIPTWYGIDLHAGRETISGDRVNPEDSKGTISYIGVSVPLVQNLVMDKRRAALKQARIFSELSTVERGIVLNDLVRDALLAYWDWWEQFQVHELMKSAVTNADARLKMVRAASQLGERPAIDTVEAYTQLQTFLLKQSEAYAALVKARLSLSVFLWTENNGQYQLPDDVQPAAFEADTVTLDEAMSNLSNHPELVQYGFKLQSLAIEKRLKFQLLLPEVNVKYNHAGYDLSKTLNGPWFNNNYRFGVSMSLPLRLSEGRGEFRQAKLKLERMRLEQTNKQAQVFTKLQQFYAVWQQTLAQVTLQAAIVTNTALLQRGEEIRFNNGEGSLFMINTRELKTIESQQKLIELRSKNQQLLAQVKWAAGMFSN